ncbi:MAG TPA: hypothetical protein VJV79_18850 [Polyangiaceae bacterium]|nr:hypothetical protein [Polyangiaceae bacterium]
MAIAPRHFKTAHRWRVTSLLGASLLSVAARPAQADVCFSTPAALPGLSGIPIWKAPGVVRSELNEPRWNAAPRLGFENDPGGNAGLYRVMVDSTRSTLAVSFQAPSQLSTPGNADVIYFGFTTSRTESLEAKSVAIQVNGIGATDPSDAGVIQQHNYDAGTWTSPLGAPKWLQDPSVWRNNVARDAAWGINFKVDLAAAGLNVTNSFKIQLAMRKHDDGTPAHNVDLSTPDPGAHALLSGTLLINDPAKWAYASALIGGCAGGLTLASEQIGSRNTRGGNLLDTTPGSVNHFFARPTVPGPVGLFPGLFQASFYMVSCNAPAAATWGKLGRVSNGSAPATDDATVELVCPANTASTTCGVATPTSEQQCLVVALEAAASQVAPIERAVAYRALNLPMHNGEAGASGAGEVGGDGNGGNPAGSGGMPSNSAGAGAASGDQNHGGRQAVDSGGTGGAAIDDGGAAGSAEEDPKYAFRRLDHCTCRIPGKPGAGEVRWTWLAFAMLALALGRRGRRGRPPAWRSEVH